jgi:hypothetical protein
VTLSGCDPRRRSWFTLRPDGCVACRHVFSIGLVGRLPECVSSEEKIIGGVGSPHSHAGSLLVVFPPPLPSAPHSARRALSFSPAAAQSPLKRGSGGGVIEVGSAVLRNSRP